MELFTQLFGDLLAFVYHCFDRIVIYGYLSGLSRPEQVVHFFRQIVGVSMVSKEILSQRTADYQNWVEAFARNHRLPIQWAEKGVRKEDHVLPWQRRMARDDAYGVYFIFKSMEQGPSFRVSVPKYATKDPNYRILARQRSRFTHYYFYLRDETLGPMVMRVASFFPFQTTYYLNGHSFIEQELKRAQIGFRKTDNAFLAVDDVTALQAAADKLNPDIIRQRLDYWTLILGPKFSAKERKQLNLSRFYAIAQIEYCRNFIFKRNFPIHKLFERSCELGLWRLTGDKIAEIFGTRLNRRMRGKLATVIDRIEHGHHVFRAYFKNAFLKQYEKFATFLRNELVSNNLADFRLKKGLDHLDAVRERFQTITARFAGFQAQWLNVHVDFPLLQRLALPITIGAVRYPGIKIHDPRVIRLLEVLLHGGSHVGGWTAKQIHRAVLTAFHLSDTAYCLNQLRYDRRELLKMLKHLAPGDVVTVTRIDRLARSTFDLFAIVKQIVDAKAQFRSLAEPWADTGTSTGRLMIAVLGGLADVERDLIRTRTAEGRSRAQKRGQHMGRKPKLTEAQQAEARKRRAEGATLAELARSYGVGKSTISRLRALV